MSDDVRAFPVVDVVCHTNHHKELDWVTWVLSLICHLPKPSAQCHTLSSVAGERKEVTIHRQQHAMPASGPPTRCRLTPRGDGEQTTL